MEVRSHDEAQRLCEWLLAYPGAVGLDTETVGWSPDDGVSPVGRAKVWCVTLAWKDQSCFVPGEYVKALTPWLESDVPQKVGTNLMGFDRHAFENSRIALSGILADTGIMSRLIDSRPDLDECGGHGAKAWGKRLGLEQAEFRDLVTVTTTEAIPGAVKEYKRVARRDGVLYGGAAQAVRFKEVTRQLSLDEVWARYPERREAIVAYAKQDPVLSLRTYEVLRGQLEKRRW